VTAGNNLESKQTTCCLERQPLWKNQECGALNSHNLMQLNSSLLTSLTYRWSSSHLNVAYFSSTISVLAFFTFLFPAEHNVYYTIRRTKLSSQKQRIKLRKVSRFSNLKRELNSTFTKVFLQFIPTLFYRPSKKQ